MRHLTIGDYEHPLIPLFSPCGRWLHSHGFGFVATWDLSSSNPQPVWMDIESAGFIFRLAVSSCGRYIAGAEDRCVIVWDRKTGGEGRWILANANGDHISDVAFTPDGTHLLTACLGDGGVQRWRAGSWRRKPAFARRARNDGALAFSPDGRTLATADSGKDDNGVRLKLWNYPRGTHRKTSKHASTSITDIEFGPDGTLIATNDDRKRVRIWNATTLAPVGEYVPRSKVKKRSKFHEPVHCFAFHPSGRYLAVAGQAGPVEFADTATWEPAVTFDWGHGPSYGVCFSPDGTLAAAGSTKGVVVWDVDV